MTFSARESSSAMPLRAPRRGPAGLRHPLGLHQQFERTEAAAAGRNLEHAGFHAIIIEQGADIEALKQGAAVDVVGQILDRDAGLDAPDIRLAQHQLVKGDVARGTEHELGQ